MTAIDDRFELHRPELITDAHRFIPNVVALQAAWRGDSTAQQNDLSFGLICKVICGVDRIVFHRDPYVTAFLEGRRFAGLEINRLAHENIKDLQSQARILSGENQDDRGRSNRYLRGRKQVDSGERLP